MNMKKKYVAMIGGAALACSLILSSGVAASAAEFGSGAAAHATGIVKMDSVYNRFVSKVSGPTKVSKKHVRYLTPTWAKASSYTWGTTTTVTSTLSTTVGVSAKEASASIGVTNSVSQAWSVSISIPASSTRYSKLALLSDYNLYKIKVQEYYVGVPQPAKYADLYSPIKGGQYLSVKYQ